MAIRTGRLHRICKRCGKSFEPSTSGSKTCNACCKLAEKRLPWKKKK